MLILAVLFLGPLVAPLFQATQLPLLADSGGRIDSLVLIDGFRWLPSATLPGTG